MQPSLTDRARRDGALYRAFWRWHFYAALIVIPFLLAASLSGALLLLSKPLDAFAQRALRVVEPAGQALAASEQMAAVRTRYPAAGIKLYVPPGSATESARFAVVMHGHGHDTHGGHGGAGTAVFVDPYRGEVLGTVDPGSTLYERIKAFHGSLYLGRAGEILIEVAAGLALLLTLSGLFLAWRPGARQANTARERWRGVHRLAGLVIALPLVFFLLSGLAWTGIWGGALVQPWNSVPGTRIIAAAGTATHDSQNRAGLHAVPWALEQTPLPAPAKAGGTAPGMTLDRAVAIARAEGFDRFRVHLPGEESAVWTISATTMAGDLRNPLAERTLHLDAGTGRPLRDIGFADYPAMGKAMSAGIPLHQGDLGAWNTALNLALCAAVLGMIGSGVAMWRRRTRALRPGLAPPPAPRAAWRAVFAGMFVIAVLFPLSAAALLGVAVLDWLLRRAMPARLPATR